MAQMETTREGAGVAMELAHFFESILADTKEPDSPCVFVQMAPARGAARESAADRATR